MSESSSWTSHPLEAAKDYVSEFAHDVLHGQAWEKHSTAIVAGGVAAAGLISLGTTYAAIRRMDAILEWGVGGDSVSAIERAYPAMQSSSFAAAAADSATLANRADIVKDLMPRAIYDRYMAVPTEEIATRVRAAGTLTDVNILTKNPAVREALLERGSDISTMAANSNMTTGEFVQNLLRPGHKAGWVDDQTLITRQFNGRGRVNDIVVRLDENTAVEQRLKAGTTGQLELSETRIYDFNSGEARSYLDQGRDGVLRTTVARDTVSGKWLSARAASLQYQPIVNDIFTQSAKGRSLLGLHAMLASI